MYIKVPDFQTRKKSRSRKKCDINKWLRSQCTQSRYETRSHPTTSLKKDCTSAFNGSSKTKYTRKPFITDIKGIKRPVQS